MRYSIKHRNIAIIIKTKILFFHTSDNNVLRNICIILLIRNTRIKQLRWIVV